ncbi:MAG TPA: hypothetical protein ENN65_08445 [Candidatus Hydrogenedentes bacterium]|nr:hypothetical protein [Candidatus Hydrogenedentota bacterium]
MGGAEIAAQISAALAEIAQELGSGEFVVVLRQQTRGQANPWDIPATPPEPVALRAIDDGIREVYVPDSGATRQGRFITIEAAGVEPKVGDVLTVSGVDHSVLAVFPLAPAGVPLLWELEIGR